VAVTSAGSGNGRPAARQPDVPTRLAEACRLQALDRPPVWLMRQAGRYLPEYRKLRERHTILELCAQPELAMEVTLQPIRRFRPDAAILFADILLPLVPMGADLEFAAGEGPVIRNGVTEPADIDRLKPVDVQDSLLPTLDALRAVRAELPADIAVIGFAGAPFTLASYLIEGGSSRRFLRTKSFMYRHGAAFDSLMAKLARVTADYLLAQIQAGADAVQLFDSWVGWLSPDDYRDFVLPHSMAVFDAVRDTGVPAIHFGVDTGGLLELLRDAGGDVIGLDWRLPLAEGWRRVGYDRGVQGNLDPAALFAPIAEVERRTRAILAEAGGRPGHIFNLGHGVLPETPVEAVQAVIETVRKWENPQ
jgi:uroporphyrinogen decarboxylase